jgi:membrane protein
MATLLQYREQLGRLKSRVAEEACREVTGPVAGFFHPALRLAYFVSEKLQRDPIRLQALSLAFKTLLSLAPLLAVAFSLLKAFGVHNRLKPTLAELLAPLGPEAENITARLVEFVDNINVNALGVVGLVLLFTTVIGLMAHVELAFNEIWRVRTPRGLGRRFTDYLSTLLVGPVLIFAALALTASLQSHALVRWLLSLEPFGTIIPPILKLVPYITIWAAFTFLYVFIPNTSVRLKSAMLGALVAAILWESAGWAFAAFVASSTKYYAVYSSFAILLLFLIWLYVGWLVVLFGAEVAYVDQHLPAFQAEAEPASLSQAARERIALQAMALIGLNFYHGKPRWNLQALKNWLRLPEAALREILAELVNRRLLVEASDGQSYLPARDLERIQLKEVLDAMRENPDPRRPSETADPIRTLLGEVDAAVAEALRGRTLKSLILSLQAEAAERLPPGEASDPPGGPARPGAETLKPRGL